MLKICPCFTACAGAWHVLSLLASSAGCGESTPSKVDPMEDRDREMANARADVAPDSGPRSARDSGSERLVDSGLHDAAGSDFADAELTPRANDAEVTEPSAAGGRLHCPGDELGFTMVDVGEVELNVGCRGTGPTIVLLHGYPTFSGTWSGYVGPLVENGFRVVVPDQRGYNLSDKPSEVEAYHFDHLVADLAGLVDATGESKVLLVGHDWGGGVAWAYGSRHQERVRGMVLMAAPHPTIWCNPEIDPVQQEVCDAYIPLIVTLGEGVFFAFDLLIGPYLTDDQLASHHEAWDRPNAKISMNNWYGANVYPEVKLPRNYQVDVKTLAIWGTQDTYVTTSELTYLPQYASDLEILTWEADHWFPLHMTDQVVAEVLRFEQTLAR